MKCGNQTCKSENRIAIGYCPECLEERTCIGWEGHPDQTFGHITYSQTGEDIVILNIFEKILGVKKPSYLDIGAYHPFNISNTALLYKRGSLGVNVDANPNLIKEFYIHRPDDINLCIGVVPTYLDDFNTRHNLHCYDSHSGRNSLVKGYLESDPDGPLSENEKIEVSVTTINKIVSDYCNKRFPDFLSVDIEGLDFDVLDSANFEEFGAPTIICVEAMPYREPEKLIKMLDKKGFLPFLRLSINILFIQKKYLSLVTK